MKKKTDTPGISDYLTGKLTSVDIIKKSEKYENLSFISSGSIHESPSELLLNGKVNKLIDELNRQYDLVIIDTAPCFLITDAFVLSELCDITLFMVRHKFTPKLLVKRLDKILEFNNLKNTSIIFNGISKRGYMENNYGYGYNYVYGGNYGVKINRKEVMKELV